MNPNIRKSNPIAGNIARNSAQNRSPWRRFRGTLAILCALGFCLAAAGADQPWTPARANEWYSQQPWLVGSNFIPSTAVNELEMWQPDTFDLPTIDRELGWAQGLGMNTMRVFLHNLLWQQDAAGFLHRLDQFLDVADKHHIRIMFVLLDSVWDPRPHLGKQPAPRPHIHNSRWVQAPGAELLTDESRWDTELKPYIAGVLRRFGSDKRVLMWDLMNEPDNDSHQYKTTEIRHKATQALKLLRQEWQWARAMNPSQPLTSGVWTGNWSNDASLSEMARFQLQNSDVITFHSYDPPKRTKRRIDSLRRYDRPIVCTEYMARPLGSTFASVLPLLKKEHVGAYNWGFVNGKSQTIYPWDSWEKSYSEEPAVWFHDIFRTDGVPYDAKETELIRQLTGADTGSR
jgi:Cellulase (glycosyl hydrolase family 5)